MTGKTMATPATAPAITPVLSEEDNEYLLACFRFLCYGSSKMKATTDCHLEDQVKSKLPVLPILTGLLPFQTYKTLTHHFHANCLHFSHTTKLKPRPGKNVSL